MPVTDEMVEAAFAVFAAAPADKTMRDRIGAALTAIYPAIREQVLREAAEHLRSDPRYDQGDMHARRLLALAQDQSR